MAPTAKARKSLLGITLTANVLLVGALVIILTTGGSGAQVVCPPPDTTTLPVTTTVPVTTTLPVTTTVPVTTTTTAPPKGSAVAFYGDSLTGDYYWHGYIGNNLAADLTAQGFGPLSVKGCGGMSLAQFVGRIAPAGAPADLACKQANTLAAHAASISTSSTVVAAFITNDWPYTATQFKADVHTAASRVLAINPTVRHIVFIKNYMTGSHSADLAAQVALENTAVVTVFDISGAGNGGNYAANCQNTANQNHPTDACWKLLASNIAAQLHALAL